MPPNISTSSVNSSAFGANNMSDPISSGSWSPLVITMLSLEIITFLSNSIALLLFAIEKDLRTSFTVYVINLQFVTFLQYGLNGFFYAAKGYYRKWIYGNAACTFYLYVHWVIGPWQNNCHVLITLNRLWATAFPVTYRNYHSSKVAVGICLGMCIVSHAYMLPRWIFDWMYYRLPLQEFACVLNCYVTPLMNGMCSATHVIEMVDEATILASFLYVWFKQSRRRRIGSQPTTRTILRTVNAAPSAVTTDHEAEGDGRSGMASRSIANERRLMRTSSSGFVVLAIMTGSVLLFWTPTVVNAMLSVTSHYYSLSLNGNFALLFMVECALDPLFFMAAIKGSKRAIRRLFDFVKR